MLVYEKWLEENEELVKHLFGTMNNIPNDTDKKLVYMDYDGNEIDDLSIDYEYLDYPPGGIVVVRATDRLPIKVFIETLDGELIQIIPKGDTKEYKVIAEEQTVNITNENPEVDITVVPTYSLPDELPNNWDVTVEGNKLTYSSEDDAYVYEDSFTGDTYSVQLRSSPKRLTLTVTNNNVIVPGEYTLDIVEQEASSDSNLVDFAIVDIAKAG